MHEEPISGSVQKDQDQYIWLQLLEDPHSPEMKRNKTLKSQTYMNWRNRKVFYWGNDKQQAHFTPLDNTTKDDKEIPIVSLDLAFFYQGIGTGELKRIRAQKAMEAAYGYRLMFS